MIAYDLLMPVHQLYPVLSKTTPQPVEWWGRKYDGPGRPPRPDGWPLKRRHAWLVRRRICHYDDGDLHTGKLHCFCSRLDRCSQGVEYGLLPRVWMKSA